MIQFLRNLLFFLVVPGLFLSSCVAAVPFIAGGIIAGSASGRGDSSIKARKLVPAEVDVSKFKKIAILDFDGKGGREIAELVETALQNIRVNERPFFEVINRSRMMKLLAEQRLSLTGFVDANQAAKIGKISGTQAIVVGRIIAFRVNEGHYNKRKTVYRNNREYIENVPCQVRDAYVDFTASFMDSQTGQIMASTSAEGQVVGDSCKGTEDLGELLAKSITDALSGSVKKETENFKVVSLDIPERMAKGAAQMAIDQFVKKIAPHYEDVPITILTSEYGGLSGTFKEKPANEKAVEVYYDTGYKYAVRGQWEDAVKQWEKILEIDNQRPAAIYNLGVAFEMMGDLYLAEKQFKIATEMKADDLFFDALARVRKSIDERKKLAQQTGKSPGRGKDGISLTQNRPVASSEQKTTPDQKTISSDGQKEKEQSAQAAKSSSIGKVKIKQLSVVVKDLPLKEGKPVATLKRGDAVEKLEEKGDWLKVGVMNNKAEIEGWIIKYDCEGYIKKQKIKKKELSPKKKDPVKQEEGKKVSPM